ncbi:MAG: hypothetical protein ACR5K7_02395 [Symbiopectobacterium sp.]
MDITEGKAAATFAERGARSYQTSTHSPP